MFLAESFDVSVLKHLVDIECQIAAALTTETAKLNFLVKKPDFQCGKNKISFGKLRFILVCAMPDGKATVTCSYCWLFEVTVNPPKNPQLLLVVQTRPQLVCQT